MIDLTNPQTGTTFGVAQTKVITGKLRRTLRRCDERRMEELVTLREENPEITEYYQLPEEERPAKTNLFILQDTKFDSRAAEINDQFQLEVFRAIIDRKSLGEEERALVDSPADGDFWMEQDIEAITSEVNRFRGIKADAGTPAPVPAGVVGDPEPGSVAPQPAVVGDAGPDDSLRSDS